MGRLIKIASYNSTGLGTDKTAYVRHLCDNQNIDILFMQETWLTERNMNQLAFIHDSYMFHGVSGIKNDELLLGRPHGGVAILWKHDLSKSATPVSVKSQRLCIVKMCLTDENARNLIV